MNEIPALILAGGASRELPVLTAYRSKAALPYGGRFRIVDFCLSNCANSNIHNVGILAQYNPASLIAHVGNGKPWDLNRRRGGLMILQPYAARTESNWFRGTADALWQHLRVVEAASAEDVLILSGDQVYKMDYGEIVRAHQYSGAWVTIAAKRLYRGAPERYGAVEIDGDGIVSRFVEKPEAKALEFFSLGIYVFKKKVLEERLAVAAEGKYDLVYDVLMPLVRERKVRAHVHDGYWADIGWVQQYYNSSLSLLDRPEALNLNDDTWPIFTKTEVRSPSRIGRDAVIQRSLAAAQCRVDGEVTRSILFPGVRVESGARIEDSIVFSDTVVKRGATVNQCILDKNVRIGRKSVVGFGTVSIPNSKFPNTLDSGITIIGKGTSVPDGVRIGRNVLIGADLTPDSIPNRDIVCGEAIGSEAKWQEISS
jgi:glucose-1-phosphate adenylyltransferase